jgi:eukaryotic-like serine/threonine-protein kinase
MDLVLPPSVRPLEVADPARIGGHRLVGRLGSGGMGSVYLARDTDGQLVAVKTVHVDDEEVRRRFRAEAACARRLPHGCTARLLADGTDQNPPYIISEYVEGRSLKDVVESDGPLPPEQLRALAVGVVRALVAVHTAGFIHRDLKPANVLLTPTGPRLIDFGIAQEVPSSGGMTGSGIVMGSAGWISPERLTRGPATSAADVFGWGCLVAYAGTARNPFGRGDVDEIARRTIVEPPDLDGLDAAVRDEVTAALAKNPADRPAAPDLLARLSPGETLASGPRRPVRASLSGPESDQTAPRSWLGRLRFRRRVWVPAAGAAVAGGVVIALIGSGADRASPATPPAAPAATAAKTPGPRQQARQPAVTPEPGARALRVRSGRATTSPAAKPRGQSKKGVRAHGTGAPGRAKRPPVLVPPRPS